MEATLQLVKSFKPGKRTIFIKDSSYRINSYFLQFPEVVLCKYLAKDEYYYCYFVKEDKLFLSALLNCDYNSRICIKNSSSILNLDIFSSYFSFSQREAISRYLFKYKECMISKDLNKNILSFFEKWQREGMFFDLIKDKDLI